MSLSVSIPVSLLNEGPLLFTKDHQISRQLIDWLKKIQAVISA